MENQARENPAVALLHERIGGVKLIGLTGGIACGKSTVSGMLKELGLPILDADQIARDVVRPGEPAYDEIVREFGTGILNQDQTLNRERLGAIVFNDEIKRRHLEEITHPHVFRVLADQVKRLAQEQHAKAIVIDAALLFESGLADSMDETLVVSVPEDIQLARLMARDGIDRETALRKIASQMPTAEKEERAGHVLDNSGDLETTRAAVALWASQAGISRPRQ